MTTRRLVAPACLVLALAMPSAARAQQPDPEAERERPAPVMLGGEPVLWVAAGAGPYTPQYRADRISRRLKDAVRDRSVRDPTVTIVESDGASELRMGPHLLMVVTARDAAALGAGRTPVAQQHARVFEEAIRAERLRYAPATLARSGVYGALATSVFIGVVWAVVRLTRTLRRRIEARIAARTEALRALQAEVLAPHRLARAINGALLLVRVFLILLALDLYLTFVLGLFPWTRAVSVKLLDYAFTPVRAVALAVAGYLPKLLFVIVIALAVTVAIRLVRAFFRQIAHGRLVFRSFPPEWADPTDKIVRVLLIAFGVVVAFPYLPASDSPAFTGVSVFMGVLVSLASSSALSNMMAGIVLTYTSAFKLGDRVKIGDAFGDIIETSLLATRVRSIKNEEITIPNSLALGSAVTNYTREASTRGLILHTSVTIGYDTPWRQVHELLLAAARATPGILADPKPFVWQTALNDFYVTYEINAYTSAPADMIDTYAVLHARIQDEFFAAGVEIMSPHYTSFRDGAEPALPASPRR